MKTKLGIGLAIVVALTLVVVSVVAATSRPATPTPPLVEMAQSAQALQTAGTVMVDHGQAMVQDGQRTGNADLTVDGKHWVADGQTLVQQGQWRAMEVPAT